MDTESQAEIENVLRELRVIAGGVKNVSTYGQRLVTVRRSEMMERAKKAENRLSALLQKSRPNTSINPTANSAPGNP